MAQLRYVIKKTVQSSFSYFWKPMVLEMTCHNIDSKLLWIRLLQPTLVWILLAICTKDSRRNLFQITNLKRWELCYWIVSEGLYKATYRIK